jgi:uncharacterized protein
VSKESISDFHLLPTANGPVIFHGASYRFFQVDNDIGRILSMVESGGAPTDGELAHARDALLRGVGHDRLQLKTNLLGDREDITVFYLFASQDCNLACGYCYGDGGDYGKRRMLMSWETANNFLDRFITCDHKYYLVNLFGGEPLMNLPVIERLVRKAKDKGRKLGFEVDFNLTTNGTLWNDRIRDFLRDDIGNITVSLDGPKDIHDSQRPARGSFSPHDRTFETLKRLQEVKSGKFVIRTIVTKNSFDKIGEIYRYNTALAPAGVGITAVDVAPGHPLALTDAEYEQMVANIVANNRTSLDAFASDDQPTFYEYTFDLFELIFFKKYRPNPCNACRAVVAVGADGDIYPCHRFVGMEEFRVGNVDDAVPLNENFAAVRARFLKAAVDDIPECSACWARYLCGGCCYVIALLREGRIDKPWYRHCHLKKTVYHHLLVRFIELMETPGKKEKLLANVTRLMSEKSAAAC